ncbi:MAG: MBOAT family O-acyltransferase [Pseudomonadota bacterium]
MSYLSITWLFWIWLTVSLYWLAPPAWRMAVLAALSFLFLVSISPLSAALLVGFTLVCHVASNHLAPTFRVSAVAILGIASALVFFKVNQTVNTDDLFDTVAIPLGMSYYTFRCIHFIMERYKGTVGKTSLNDLIGYLFFIPTLVVGPIHRFDDYRRDRLRQRFDPAMLSDGAERILYGYAKIVVLSNFLTEALLGDAIAGFADQDSVLVLYLKTVQNGLNLYFQFSGYSDIAIGFARLLGFRVLENFNWPYLQSNISAFWRSWHISLSRWCRDYIYGVTVAKTRSPALGALATMVTIGLWHEISLRFLLWGAYHGLGIIIWQMTQRHGDALTAATPAYLQRPLHVAKVIFTVHFVWFGFIILTAESVGAAALTFQKLFLFWL